MQQTFHTGIYLQNCCSFDECQLSTVLHLQEINSVHNLLIWVLHSLGFILERKKKQWATLMLTPIGQFQKVLVLSPGMFIVNSEGWGGGYEIKMEIWGVQTPPTPSKTNILRVGMDISFWNHNSAVVKFLSSRYIVVITRSSAIRMQV